MLQQIAKLKNNHIVRPITAWMDHDTYYILYPLAKYNLRQFMRTEPQPELTSSKVLWFIQQLKGLADALRQIHHMCGPDEFASDSDQHLSPKPKKGKKRRTGFHHDIKPDNILVFEGSSEHGTTLKMADFGSGKVSRQLSGQLSARESNPRGTVTYESPDVKVTGHAGRPHDLWATGCVFLELLIWMFIEQNDEEDGFSTERGWISASQPTASNDNFWCEKPDGIQLKPMVTKKLDDLEEYFIRKRLRPFEQTLTLTRKLFTIESDDRITARDLHDGLVAALSQAMGELDDDPCCYVHRKQSRDSLSSADIPVNFVALTKSQPSSRRNSQVLVLENAQKEPRAMGVGSMLKNDTGDSLSLSEAEDEAGYAADSNFSSSSPEQTRIVTEREDRDKARAIALEQVDRALSRANVSPTRRNQSKSREPPR